VRVYFVSCNVRGAFAGWRFSGDGKLVDVPQLKDPKALQAACDHKKSSVAAYPTQVSPMWPKEEGRGSD
jgi:phenylpropionate dioxygenase-like ring-hydroxylating dioxygenase large terminal subunit